MSRRFVPWGIGLLALTARLLYVWSIRDTPLTDLLLIDSETYDRLARLVAARSFHGEEVYAMNVLYPFFLAAIYTVTKGGIFAVFVVQSVLDAGSCVLLWWLGVRHFSTAVGIIAGTAAALYAPFVFHAGTLLTPTLITFLVLATLALLTAYEDRLRWPWALTAGLALGLAALGRGNNVLYVPLALFGFLAVAGSRRRALGHWAVFAAAALGIVGFATLRNYLVEGKLVPIAANYAAFYVGHHDKATGLYTMPSFTQSAEFEKEVWGTQRAVSEMLGRPVTLAESSQHLFREGLRHVAEHPRDELRLGAMKLLFFWNRTEPPTNLSVYFARDFSDVLRFLPLAFGVVAPLALVGLVLARRMWRRHLFLHLLIAVYVFTAVAFFVSTEYRLSVVPVLMLFAAYAVVRVARALREWSQPGERRVVAFAVLLLVPLAVVCNVRTPLLRAQSLKRVDYLNFGTLYKKRGNLPAARRMLERSLDIDPRFGPAYIVLAEVEDLAGNEMEAARLAGLGRRYRPAGEAAHPSEELSSALLRAGGLYRSGLYAEALQSFEALLVVAEAAHDTTVMASLLNNVGLCRFKLGEHDRAVAIWTDILAHDPGYVKAYNNLGMVREAQGKVNEAIAQYERALGIDPGNQVAQRALGRIRGRG